MINDGGASSSAVTSTITIGDANDAPVLSDASATLAYTEGDSATVIDASLTIADVDDTNIASPQSPSVAAISPARMSWPSPTPMTSRDPGTVVQAF